MTSKMKMVGTSNAHGIKTESWTVNKTAVIVSRDNLSLETGRKCDGEVLHISFSHMTGDPPRQDIEYALTYFGFDLNRHHYAFMKPSFSLYRQTFINIYHYEQIQPAN